MKDKVAAVVDARSDSLKSLAREIFSYEETAFQEVRSSRALADYLEKAGLRWSGEWPAWRRPSWRGMDAGVPILV